MMIGLHKVLTTGVIKRDLQERSVVLWALQRRAGLQIRGKDGCTCMGLKVGVHIRDKDIHRANNWSTWMGFRFGLEARGKDIYMWKKT